MFDAISKKLAKFTLNQLLFLGFGLTTALLLIVAIESYRGLHQGYDNFTNYRNLARDTNLSGRIQANMLMVRLNVLKYIDSASPENKQKYTDRLEKVLSFLDTAKHEIEQPQRAQDIQKISHLVSQYNQAFEQIIQLIEQRNKDVKQLLDPTGLAMRQKMTKILDSAYQDQDSQASYYAAKAQEALLLGRLYVTKFLVTNAKKDYQRAKVELEQNLQHTLTELDKQLQNPHRRQLLADIQQLYHTYVKALDDIQQTIVRRNDIIENTLNQVGSHVAQLTEQLKLSVKKEQDLLGPQAQADAEASVNNIMVTSIISVILAIVISIVMVRIIKRPIGGEPQEIANIAQKIADGDLSQQLNKPNASGIYQAMVEMTSKLKTLLQQIQQSGQQLSENSGLAADVSHNTTEVVTQQGELTAQLASAINEMAYSIQEVVNHAIHSSESADNAQKQAIHGKNTVENSRQAIHSLADKVADSVAVMHELEQASVNIGEVVTVIRNISEQTNLLALNAAIEAARAGEQGRGFAVVADEVRTLAQRTQESTTQINDMIQTLQQGSAKAVEVMQQSSDGVQATVDTAEQTEAALNEILVAIEQISEINNLVSTAVNEQSIVVEEINNKVTEIANLSVNSAEQAEKAASASEDISSLSDNLLNLTKTFKV